MFMKLNRWSGVFFSAILLSTVISCTVDSKHSTPPSPSVEAVKTQDQSLSDYWYQGKAELSSYDLQQVRYGEVRKGEGVLIFVAEDFSKSKQVKLDNPTNAGQDKLPVLKLNYSKKFNTGIYPYSMLLSSFTEVGSAVSPYPVKLNVSVQEWCGHVFTQVNRKEGHYEVQQFSYFETEGDQRFTRNLVWSEDAIFNQIRINPAQLPTGDVDMLPGLFYVRLKHKPYEVVKVKATLMESSSTEKVYALDFVSLQRKLNIRFSSTAPYEILGWEESYQEGAASMTTTAKLKKKILLDYWNFNHEADASYRKELMLDF